MLLREIKGSPLTHQELDQNFNACLGVHNLLHVEDQKPAGTNGGDFISGAWRTRDLNTVVINNIVGASLNNNQITLPAGEYWVEGSAPAHFCDEHKIILISVSPDTDTVLIGSQGLIYGDTSLNIATLSVERVFISGGLTLVEEKGFQLQHRCMRTRDNNGFGRAADMGYHELYSNLKIWKVG
ncbi:MAG: hypothetical protein ACOCZ5_00800 [bacterium]